jgi:predicted Rossmann fold flavoprotein
MSAEPTLPAQCRVAVIGGGAAGFFAAIACAEAGGGPVVLLEKSSMLLAKVKISGGGRCNVTQACFDPAVLVTRYPRGGRELRGPLHQFQPSDTIEWFESRGVRLKTEPDGRVFPITDRSETIVQCLMEAASTAGVTIVRQAGVDGAARVDGRFRLSVVGARTMECEKLIVSTGGARTKQGGPSIAAAFGHTLTDPVPSLFTFHIEDPRLQGLAGLSVEAARVRVPGAALDETGPVLITHWGLSGPAILRLSAWGARWMHGQNFEFVLRINWCGSVGLDGVLAHLRKIKETDAKKLVGGDPQFAIPARLWERLVEAAAIPADTRWAHLRREQFLALGEQLTAGEFAVRGKSMNKEEFVTCGGVTLREVDFRTMASRRCEGLYFAGEVLDIDGITGGYNFQAAWSTGWIAGRAAAARENEES